MFARRQHRFEVFAGGADEAVLDGLLEQLVPQRVDDAFVAGDVELHVSAELKLPVFAGEPDARRWRSPSGG